MPVIVVVNSNAILNSRRTDIATHSFIIPIFFRASTFLEGKIFGKVEHGV